MALDFPVSDIHHFRGGVVHLLTQEHATGIAELDLVSIFEKNVGLDPLSVHKRAVQAAEVLHHVALAFVKSNHTVLFGHDAIEHLDPVLRMTANWVVLC